MTEQREVRRRVSEKPLQRHLELDEVAAYVDGSVPDDVRAGIEDHLASCAGCRAEVAEVSRIVAAVAPPRWAGRSVWILAAAAVAAVLLALPRTSQTRMAPEHREAAVTNTVAPRAVVPRGAVESATAFVWSAVPYADAYRVRVFDPTGTVIWESETADTIAQPPRSIVVRAGRPYYWKVEARTGFDRWASSDLVQFTVGRGSEP
jgi:anti-sigma factor RsiW